jgi:hypothetical protein
MAQATCPHCGGRMKKKSVGNLTGMIWALILICIGLVVTIAFWWTGVALIAGPLICLYGVTRGGKRVLKCRGCGYYVQRA